MRCALHTVHNYLLLWATPTTKKRKEGLRPSVYGALCAPKSRPLSILFWATGPKTNTHEREGLWPVLYNTIFICARPPPRGGRR